MVLFPLWRVSGKSYFCFFPSVFFNVWELDLSSAPPDCLLLFLEDAVSLFANFQVGESFPRGK
jgi:hypothetical protein